MNLPISKKMDTNVLLNLKQRCQCNEMARRLLLPSALANWVKVAKAGKLSEIGKTQRPLAEIALELARIKRELADVRMECSL